MGDDDVRHTEEIIVLKMLLGKWFANRGKMGESVEYTAEENNMAEEDTIKEVTKTLVITRDWLEKHNIKDANTSLMYLAEKSKIKGRIAGRIRLFLDASLQEEMDDFLARRITKYLNYMEEECLDFTYFLDKEDPCTMEIYKRFLLPEEKEETIPFFHSRVLFIYDSAKQLGFDYKDEVSSFARALGIHLGARFFEEFAAWMDEQEKKIEEWDSYFNIRVTRNEIESGALTPVASIIEEVMHDPAKIRNYKGKLTIEFPKSMLDDTLGPSPELVYWTAKLIESYPFLFYFLNSQPTDTMKRLIDIMIGENISGNEAYFQDVAELKAFIVENLQRFSEWADEDVDDIVQTVNFLFRKKLVI